MVEVHFDCAKLEDAIVRSCAVVNGVGTVAIPDICLEQATPITAWVYQIGGTSGATTKIIKLNITPRTRPSDSEDIPSTVSDKYTEAVEEMNLLIDEVKNGTLILSHASHALKSDTADRATIADRAEVSDKATIADEATHAATSDTATRATTATVATRAATSDKATEATTAETITPEVISTDDTTAEAFRITHPGFYVVDLLVQYYKENWLDGANGYRQIPLTCTINIVNPAKLLILGTETSIYYPVVDSTHRFSVRCENGYLKPYWDEGGQGIMAPKILNVTRLTTYNVAVG